MDTQEQFAKLNNDDDIMKWEFSDIPENERLNVDQTLCGMLKVQTLMKKPARFWLGMCAEHDIIYFPTPDEISEEDAIYLLRCGLFFDTECDCLSIFT